MAALRSFFSRPAETRMMRCYDPPWDQDDDRIWHKSTDTIAYADGHVKVLSNSGDNKVPVGYISGCDGPTWAWDDPGSCNSSGLQRNGD